MLRVLTGIPTDSVYSSGWTPLMYAANSANVECVQVLLEAGADPNFHKGKVIFFLF